MTVPRVRDDAGFATIWVLTCCAVLATACALGAVQGTAILTRHRAAAAADAAALAAARLAPRGPDAACAGARRIAAADGAVLTSCDVGGLVATVTTRVRPPRWLAWSGSACGQARAGQIPADRHEPLEGGQRRNLDRSISLCPVSKRQ